MQMVPKLRFKEFNDEWEERTIEKISNNVLPGATPKTSIPEYWENGYIPWMSSGEINKKRVYQTEKFITQKGFDNSSTSLIPINSVLMALAGQGKTRGKVAVNKIELATNQSIAAIILKNDYNYEFVYHNLDSRYEEIRLISSVGEGRGGINVPMIKSFKIFVTSVFEQQKIASFLSSYDDLISAQERLIEKLEIQKKGIMQKIFSHEIRFRNENGNEFPEWGVCTVDDIFYLTRGRVIAKSSITEEPTHDNIYPVYSSQTTNQGILGYDKIYDFDGDYLTWTTDGANAGKVFKRVGKFNCTNVCGLLVEKEDTKGFANKCVAEILDQITPRHVSYVGNPKLMNNVMSKIRITIPCIKEQQKISSFLSSLDEQVDKEKKILELMKTVKKGLLQQMFA